MSTLSQAASTRTHVYLCSQDAVSFCYNDYSPAPDTLLLSEYLAHENESIDLGQRGSKTSIVPCVLFVAPAPDAPPSAPAKPPISASTLSKGSFAVLAYELVEGEPTSRGALESGALGVSEPVKLTLADLRKRLATATRMYVSFQVIESHPFHHEGELLTRIPRSTKHKFCTPSGMPAVDESMTFAAYLRLEVRYRPPKKAFW